MDITFNELPGAVSLIFEKLIAREKHMQQLGDMQTPNQDEILTVNETANFLGLSKATVYTKASNRELPSMKIGNRLKFSKKDLIELMKSGKRKSYAEIALEVNAYGKGGIRL